MDGSSAVIVLHPPGSACGSFLVNRRQKRSLGTFLLTLALRAWRRGTTRRAALDPRWQVGRRLPIPGPWRLPLVSLFHRLRLSLLLFSSPTRVKGETCFFSVQRYRLVRIFALERGSILNAERYRSQRPLSRSGASIAQE